MHDVFVCTKTYIYICNVDNNSTKRKDERLELCRSNGSISHEIKLINSKVDFDKIHIVNPRAITKEIALKHI